jgi:hypothetical protein
MLLPGGTRAVVDIAKLRDYTLSPAHPRGRNKARVFAAALQIQQSDAEFLRRELLSAAATGSAILARRDSFGQRYLLDFECGKGDHRAIVRTGWIVLTGEDFPRLTTCFVLSR